MDRGCHKFLRFTQAKPGLLFPQPHKNGRLKFYQTVQVCKEYSNYLIMDFHLPFLLLQLEQTGHFLIGLSLILRLSPLKPS